MAKRLGIGCIVLGVFCLLVSIGFALFNSYEAQEGEKASQTVLQEVKTMIAAAEPESIPEETQAQFIEETQPRQMQTVPVGKYDSIGILSIPVLELELPVLADWTYAKLKQAPCHYFGSCYEENFVIAAHNYPSHFGRISHLKAGDLVTFTDVSGTVHGYEVVLVETLLPTATEEMITSGFDLSLYTCTPGGGSRVTVRCRAII